MKRYQFVFLFSLSFIVSCKKAQTTRYQRAQEPWAIRSVLDYQPRMLTLALDTNMYVAYNLENCLLYKVWKGGVNWDGLVYNDRKVIQPTTWGTDYVSGSVTDCWWFTYKGNKIIPEVGYYGYYFKNKQIYLSYQLISGQDTVRITERPEYYLGKDHKPSLERIFYRSGSSGPLVYLRTQSQTLQLNQEKTNLRTEFDELPTQVQNKSKVRSDDKGRYWLEKSDCLTCHEWSENTVGPGFEQIAQRYADTEKVVKSLVEKVKIGGSGRWGTSSMNPHPDIQNEDLQLMVKFILSLDGQNSDQNKKSTNHILVLDKPKYKPGFGAPLVGLHPSYKLEDLEPPGYHFAVGGLAFFPDGKLLVTTWTAEGSVYILDGLQSGDIKDISVKQIAEGLMEPLGAEVVDGSIYVLQKQELTKLIDRDGDEIIDEYQVVCNKFGVSTDFHEFAFGLIYSDGNFYANLSVPMRLMTNEVPLPDRGRTVKIAMDGSFENLNHGLRQPNGIGFGVDGQIFITDNQGQWLPSNKLIHVRKGAFHGLRWGLPDSLKNIEETPPAVWLPQDEIANSPSEPTTMNDGPYQGQMLFGDVSHGGIKRLFLEKINGQYQGAVFRFTQGLRNGVNRLRWGPDGALYIGQIGMVGSLSKQHGLQRLRFNGAITFEMLSIKLSERGFIIEFTQPLAEEYGISPDDYLIQQWWYKPTESYGGPKMDLETLNISNLEISNDRRSVQLEIPGLKTGHIIYFRLSDALTSASGQTLWSGEAWYTLNDKYN